MTRLIIDVLLITLLLIIGWIVISGGQAFEFEFATISLRHLKNPSILLILLLVLRLLVFPTKYWQLSRSILLFAGLRSVLFLLLSIVAVKSVVSLLDEFYFYRKFSFNDWLHTYSIDLSIVFSVLVVLLGLGFLCLIGKSRQPDQAVLEHSPNKLSYVFITLLVWFSTAAGAFYVLLGYIYFEWGSFIEPHHVKAISMAGVGPEFNNLFLRSYTLAAVCLVLLVYWLAQKIQTGLQSRRINPLAATAGAMCLLLPAITSYSSPLTTPAKFAPTVQSPLLMLMQPIADNTDGFTDFERLGGVDISDYAPYTKRKVKQEYVDLLGAATGLNVIFYVMESVRRQNLSHYGYHRETMPTLTKLIEHSLVFNNAYVMQPRSSKAMSALALGVMPDPRLKPLSWNPKRITGKDTLFKRLMANGRHFYIGTTQPYGGDNLQKFFIETAGHKQQIVISHEDLVKDASLKNDDVGLSQHFNRWVSENDQPFVGLLWTECAHMPYVTEKAPFGRVKLIDKYDNCLHQVDRGLSELISGLERINKLDNTLLVIFGDHGEALGEKFDRGHGSYLYEHSMRIPFFIFNSKLFPQSREIDARFQLKDVPTTVLSLLGLPTDLNQSENIFSKESNDPVYMSNVYQDYKMGMIEGTNKYIYRPRFDMSIYFDLQADPTEDNNIVSQQSEDSISQKQLQLLRWYKYQTKYIESNFPNNK